VSVAFHLPPNEATFFVDLFGKLWPLAPDMVCTDYPVANTDANWLLFVAVLFSQAAGEIRAEPVSVLTPKTGPAPYGVVLTCYPGWLVKRIRREVVTAAKEWAGYALAQQARRLARLEKRTDELDKENEMLREQVDELSKRCEAYRRQVIESISDEE
jgi:hypothetical protein